MAVGAGACVTGIGGGARFFLTVWTTLGGVGSALGGAGVGAFSGTMKVAITSFGMALATWCTRPLCRAQKKATCSRMMKPRGPIFLAWRASALGELRLITGGEIAFMKWTYAAAIDAWNMMGRAC